MTARKLDHAIELLSLAEAFEGGNGLGDLPLGWTDTMRMLTEAAALLRRVVPPDPGVTEVGRAIEQVEFLAPARPDHPRWHGGAPSRGRRAAAVSVTRRLRPDGRHLGAVVTARKPRVGDVWRCTYGAVTEDVLIGEHAEDVDDWTAALEDPEWRKHSTAALVGRVVPPDHPGVDALRLLLPMLSVAPSSLWQPEEQAALDALASLLALIEGDPDAH